MNTEQSFIKSKPSNEMLNKVLSFFAILWLISGLGVVLGQFVPPALMLPLIIVEILLLIAMIFVRKAKKAGRIFAIVFSLISGITLFPVLTYYVGAMGGELVLAIFISTAVVFAAYGFIGYRLTKDLGGWANYLFVGVLGLIVVSVFGIFIPFSNVMTMFISMAGVLIFSLYTIYDFNQIRHRKMDDRDIPFVAIGLYLDFLNLFLNLLRLVNALRQ